MSAKSSDKDQVKFDTDLTVLEAEMATLLSAKRWERKVAAVAIIVAIISLLSLIIVLIARPEPQNYGLTADHRLIPLTPIESDEGYSPGRVISFAADCLSKANQLVYSQYRQQLSNLGDQCFSTDGFTGYLDGLEKSGLIKGMVSRKEVWHPRVAPGVIVNEGVSPTSGRYTWVVETPVTAVREYGGDRSSQSMLVTLRITRVSRATKTAGLQIDQYVAKI